jgi:hypothetical protein
LELGATGGSTRGGRKQVVRAIKRLQRKKPREHLSITIHEGSTRSDRRSAFSSFS